MKWRNGMLINRDAKLQKSWNFIRYWWDTLFQDTCPRYSDISRISESAAQRGSAGKFRIVGLPTDAGPTSRVIRRAIYFTGGGSALTYRAWRSAALRPLDDFNKLSKQRLGARVLALAWEGINATDELKAAICRSSHHLSKDTTCIIELGAIILERRRNTERWMRIERGKREGEKAVGQTQIAARHPWSRDSLSNCLKITRHFGPDPPLVYVVDVSAVSHDST